MNKDPEAQRGEVIHPESRRHSVAEPSLHCAAGIVSPAGRGHNRINDLEGQCYVVATEVLDDLGDDMRAVFKYLLQCLGGSDPVLSVPRGSEA